MLKRENAVVMLQSIQVAVFSLSLFLAQQTPASPLTWITLGLLQNVLWLISFGLSSRANGFATSNTRFTSLLALAPLVLLLASGWLSPFETDFYRYEWDGRALLAGINPYSHAPATTGFAPELVAKMNYSHLSTVYSPLAIGTFAFAAQCGDLLHIGFLDSFRILLWLVAAASIFGAVRGRSPSPKAALATTSLWLLHPLLLREGLANAHYDVLLAATLLASVVWLSQTIPLTRFKKGIALGLALGAASLKLPGMLLASLLSTRRGSIGLVRAAFSLITVTATILLLVWLSHDHLSGFRESLQLYSSSWEVNSGAIRWVRDFFFWTDDTLDFEYANRFAREILFILGASLCASLWWIRSQALDEREVRGFWIFFLLAWLAPASNAWYYLWALFFIPAMGNHRIQSILLIPFVLLPLADAHWLHQYVLSPEFSPALAWTRDTWGAETLWNVEHLLVLVWMLTVVSRLPAQAKLT